MALKKSSGPSVKDLIRANDIPNTVTIRHITDKEEKKWRLEGLGAKLLVLGKRHIEVLRFPIPPLILQFAAAHRVHLMQLTPNSIKFLVAAVILNEVEGKKITLNDLLFALRINKTPLTKDAPVRSFQTFYLSSNAPHTKKYYMFTGKHSVDKDWEVSGGIFVIGGSWAPPNFDREAYPIATKFGQTVRPRTFHLPQDRIDALIQSGVFFLEQANARDLDSICSAEAMECLSGDTDMVRDQKRLKQVRATIVRLEAAAKEREKNKAPSKAQGKGKRTKGKGKRTKGKGKRTKGKSTPSPNTELPAQDEATQNQSANREVPAQVPGSDHESDHTPLVTKRKRSEHTKGPRGSSANPALSSGKDDQQVVSLSIKIKYSQGPSSKTSPSANPISASSDSASLTILPTPTSSLVPVVNLQDSDDDMGLKTNAFDLMASQVQSAQSEPAAARTPSAINTAVEIARSNLEKTISAPELRADLGAELSLAAELPLPNAAEHSAVQQQPLVSAGQDNEEHALPSTAEQQANPTLPSDERLGTLANPPLPSDECPRTPPPVCDEGCGAGVGLKSMFVDNIATNAGTSEQTEQPAPPFGFDANAPFRPEPFRRLEDGSRMPLKMGESLFDMEAAMGIVDSCIPPGMVAEALGCKSSLRIGMLKQAAVVSASATLAMEQEMHNLIREHTELEYSVDSKQQMIDRLKASLSAERTVKAHLRQDLKKAREELKTVQEQQQENNERCLKAATVVEEFGSKYNDAQNKVKELETELETAKAALSLVEEAKTKIEQEKGDLQNELQKKNAELESSNTQVSEQKSELDMLKQKVAALEATNAEQERNLMEARIAAVEQRKDDARRLKKRYTKEMNVHLAHMFYEASQQAALPAEQRTLTPQQLCEILGVEMGKFDPRPYLENMKAEIEISYPRDIIAVIAERKAVARAGASSSGVQVELGSATPALRAEHMPSVQGTSSANLALVPVHSPCPLAMVPAGLPPGVDVTAPYFRGSKPHRHYYLYHEVQGQFESGKIDKGDYYVWLSRWLHGEDPNQR